MSSASAATQFTLTGTPTTTVSGSLFNVTVTAKDQFGNTATGYTGIVHFSSSDAAASALAGEQHAGQQRGQLRGDAQDRRPRQTVTATDTAVSRHSSLTGHGRAVDTVTAGAATHFSVTAPPSATAGTADHRHGQGQLDANSNVATTYAGHRPHFTSSDTAAVLPSNNTLSSGTSATGFNVTLNTVGLQNITATDTAPSGAITGTSGAITVTAPTVHFTVTAPSSVAAGTAFSFTVTAHGCQQQSVPRLHRHGPFQQQRRGSASLPVNATLTSGTGTFGATLRTVGNQTITATDTGSSGITGTSGLIAVTSTTTPQTATHFSVTAPATATAGSAFTVTVSALDVNNAVVTGYTGTVHITSSDAQSVLPPNATLTSGTGTFTVTLKTAGTQSITATDTVSSGVTGTAPVSVIATTATHFTVTAPSSTTAGAAFVLTVTALDAFNNTATGYTGIAHFTSTDAQAGLPANSTLTNGEGFFAAILKTAGVQTITATDTLVSSLTATSGPITVSAAAATHFAVTGQPTTVAAGGNVAFTVTAEDQFNNTAIGYLGTVHLTTTDAQVTPPADSTLTAGIGLFNIGLKTAGVQTLTATDTVSTGITGTSNAITVTAGAATHYAVTAPATTTAGSIFVFIVTAEDQFNNTATAYTGTAHFTSNDPLATLPVDSTLTNGVGACSGPCCGAAAATRSRPRTRLRAPSPARRISASSPLWPPTSASAARP